ncbi:unnamed protein product [Boreogadus saida]
MEVFTNLSLDLEPGDSVSQALDRYLTESSLKYACQCGGNTSGMQTCFLSLPNVLVLHLKRFRFTLTGRIEKVEDEALLSRHLGLSIGTGEVHTRHYISEGAYPEEGDNLADQWLRYNDLKVSRTTGRAVCRQRQRTAYLLFYQRQPLQPLGSGPSSEPSPPREFCCVEQSGVWLGGGGRALWSLAGVRDVEEQTNIPSQSPRAPRDHAEPTQERWSPRLSGLLHPGSPSPQLLLQQIPLAEVGPFDGEEVLVIDGRGVGWAEHIQQQIQPGEREYIAALLNIVSVVKSSTQIAHKRLSVLSRVRSAPRDAKYLLRLKTF